MRAIELFEAMGNIGDELILESISDGSEYIAPFHTKKKIFRIIAIAAAITALLGVVVYAIYIATMTHREPRTDDAMSYYLNTSNNQKENPKRLDLNFGECALVLHFETQETGPVHAFQFNTIPSDWSWESESGYSLWNRFQLLGHDEWYITWPSYTPEEALRKTGLTETEAKAYSVKGHFYRTDGSDQQVLHITIHDGPGLFGTDLIYGWPKGTATIIREDTWGEYQRLEIIIDREWGEDEHEVNKFLLLFHPTEQYFLSFSAPDEMCSFEDMETLMEEIEVIETDFVYSKKESGMNFSIEGHAFG